MVSKPIRFLSTIPCERLTAECTLTGVLLKCKYWVTSDKLPVCLDLVDQTPKSQINVIASVYSLNTLG